jgi:ubiquinone biosynthesis monooxygenase Coq7
MKDEPSFSGRLHPFRHAARILPQRIFAGVNQVGDMTALTSFNADQIRALVPTVPDLMRNLRSDHAGEAGAVMIYRGILAGSRLAGWLTGFLPALVSPRAVYSTIEAVETFVDRHYQAQIHKLAQTGASGALRSVPLNYQQDELHHRDEARAAQNKAAGPGLRIWTGMINIGSRAAVVLARRV